MLTTQKPAPLVPNAVLVSNVTIVTTIAGGKLLTRANLALEPANVANAGTPQEVWAITGPAVQLTLPNLAALPPDLASCTRRSPPPRPRSRPPWGRSMRSASWSESRKSWLHRSSSLPRGSLIPPMSQVIRNRPRSRWIASERI